MRPVRLHVEGFSAYREPVEVDFTGVEFFSLTGPTGSGKSSLVDAMIFALFGRVPRLGGNAVAPAISAGADRARVRFDFAVGDTVYTAVRMAQRTATGGASVREARLEQGDQVLADGADDVTEAVEELLRLRFEDFTRTVVLPQGDFARFLTATKAERQGLLRSLLGLEVYTTVRELARTRSAISGERAEGARRALEGLDVADTETLELAVARSAALADLMTAVSDGEKALSGLDLRVEAARAESARLTGLVTDVTSIEAPDRLEELDTLIVESRSRAVDTEEAVRAAKEELARVEQALSALPRPDQIESWRRARSRLDELEARLDDAGLEQARTEMSRVEEDLRLAVGHLADADRRVESERSRHAAHLLASGLRVGEPCPVCLHEVGELPGATEQGSVEAVEADRSLELSKVESLRAAAVKARDLVVRLEAARAEIEAQANEERTIVATAPSAEEVEELAIRRGELDGEALRRRDALAGLEMEMGAARAELESVADASRRLSRLLVTAQLKVAVLEPPLSESDDVVVQWKDLLEWREQTLARLGEELEAAAAGVEEAVAAAEVGRQELAEMLSGQGIPLVQPYTVQVATAHQAARALVESYQRAAEQAAELTELERTASEDAAVANALAGHLRADGFEQWMMAGALTELVAGANDLLGQLSAGGYSLATDASGGFSIIDHRNADERRSVNTLSGGETFLVSLALALSLAETLSAKGGSGLDAIILDEGFGTLDDESLDTVAAVLEELTERGLVVGIISHVKELAARAPVRFEVSREPTGARVRLLP